MGKYHSVLTWSYTPPCRFLLRTRYIVVYIVHHSSFPLQTLLYLNTVETIRCDLPFVTLAHILHQNFVPRLMGTIYRSYQILDFHMWQAQMSSASCKPSFPSTALSCGRTVVSIMSVIPRMTG